MKNQGKILKTFAIVLFFAIIFVGGASAQNLPVRWLSTASGSDSGLVSAVNDVLPSVVSIAAQKDVAVYRLRYRFPFLNDGTIDGGAINGAMALLPAQSVRKTVSEGTGIIITKNGYILTNDHVVNENGVHFSVLLGDGTSHDAAVAYSDPAHDLAIVKINGGPYHAADLGDSGTVHVGDTVAAIGNAEGQNIPTVTTGTISDLGKNVDAFDDSGGVEKLKGVIQMDGTIVPGDSGGPMVDAEGRVVGINTATNMAEHTGIAIPVNTAKKVISEFFGGGNKQ
jgi:S1-C subfamily serine protease